jgi:aerobic-type carbon monoxide dehydrogenase small subunit (CoxS/CutS family)
MSNEQQPDPTAQGPQRGWGGEYDADATAYIELPGGYPPEGGEPLAAPGHGYQPPEIGAPATPPATAGATIDPGATGQWTMPFAGGAAPADPATDAAHPPAWGRAAAMGQGAALADRETAAWPPPEPAGRDGTGHPEPGGPPDDEPVAEDATEHGDAPDGARSEHPEVSYVLRVNGVDRPVTGAWIGESLLYVLRERLGLAGAKDGCAQGECGACSVQVDGRLVAACLVPAATAAGSEIRTVEGLGRDGAPSDVQRALAASDVQCGFCLPGMAMTVHDLLEGNHAPTELETRQALCGNLCRCTNYRGVLDAVRAVVEERTARAEAAAEAAPPRPAGPGDAARIPHQSGPGAGGI